MAQEAKIDLYNIPPSSSLFKTQLSINIRYTAGTPNGQKISCTLEELGIKYNVHHIDISKNQQKEGWYLDINRKLSLPLSSIYPEPPGHGCVRIVLIREPQPTAASQPSWTRPPANPSGSSRAKRFSFTSVRSTTRTTRSHSPTTAKSTGSVWSG